LIVAGALLVCAVLTVLLALRMVKRIARSKRAATQMDQTVDALRKVARGATK
jgi:hypothetical protein